MGGNNTKPEAASDWNKHRTSEQSSTLPYQPQIHNKYENNIQSLIDNLHTTTADNNNYNFDNFAKVLNNTLSYNTKYENTLYNNKDDIMHSQAQVSDTYESPFLSHVKYANLLNSATSDNIQHG